MQTFHTSAPSIKAAVHTLDGLRKANRGKWVGGSIFVTREIFDQAGMLAPNIVLLEYKAFDKYIQICRVQVLGYGGFTNYGEIHAGSVHDFRDKLTEILTNAKGRD